MAIPHRAPNHGTYFITSATYNRRRLFQTTANAELLLETLQHYRREGNYNRGPRRTLFVRWGGNSTPSS